MLFITYVHKLMAIVYYYYGSSKILDDTIFFQNDTT